MDPLLLLEHALYSQTPVEALESLQEEGFFKDQVPEVQALVGFGNDVDHKDLWAHTKQVVAQTPTSVPYLRWAALFHDVGKPTCFHQDEKGKISFHGHEPVSAKLFNRAATRLGFRNEPKDRVAFLIRHLGFPEEYSSDWTDSAVRRLYKLLGPHFQDVMTLAKADMTTKNKAKWTKNQALNAELCARAEQLAKEDAILPALPSGLGTALMEKFGLKEGPELGKAMVGLKKRVEAGELPRSGPFEVYLEAFEA